MRAQSLTRLLLGALIGVAAWTAACAAGAAAQPPALTEPLALDGPSADIVGLSGLSVARDGSGGLVYLKLVSSVAHVFVSRLAGGVFQTPVQVDAGLSGVSSQPVIAAGNRGVLLIGFINGGQLYVVQAPSSGAPFGAPQSLFTGASNPVIQMSNFGKAYIAFTALDGPGSDVRCAYYYDGAWALEPTPLNVVAADDAGTGAGRPAVAAAGDGVAIVAWGEQGHIYTRRVWGTMPSVAYEQADVPSFSGWTEVSAGDPGIGSGGSSSQAAVVFEEALTNGTAQQSRVLVRALNVESYGPVSGADGLTTPGAEGAQEPQIATGEYNSGFVTSARETSNQVFVTQLGNGGLPGSTIRLDSLANASAPDAVPAITDYYSGLIVWQHDPGAGASPEIRARYYDGSDFGPEMVVSSPSFGPADAADGLAAAGDIVGDVAVAWVQETGDLEQIVTAEVLVGPGSFAPDSAFRYVNTDTPVLAWSAPREYWGPLRYDVSVNGAVVAQTTATSTSVSLPQGPVTWQVTAVNNAGLTSTAKAAEVWVDTVAPAVTLTLTGTHQVGSHLHAQVVYTDAPPPEPLADASGIASVVINWGDGYVYAITHGKYHAYRQPGSYRVTVTVTDRAGNVTTVAQALTITRKPHKKKKKGKP